MPEARTDGVVVFDLDDTLYSEEDFLLSAYRLICERIAERTGEDHYGALVGYRDAGLVALDELLARHEVPYTIAELLELYRYHAPSIELRPGVAELLERIRAWGLGLALITDGRSRTQRAKLEALGVAEAFDYVSVSEEIGATKPSPLAFERTMAALPAARYAYVGDNYGKDFVAPNTLGWLTIGLRDDGRNIHERPRRLPPGATPAHDVDAIADIRAVLREAWRLPD